MANKNLNTAKTNKKDEFYTQLSDIENELKHYRQHFRGKVILCNCDDPYESNFFKYFANNFNAFGLKKLIATCYNGSPVTGSELTLFALDTEGEEKKVAYKVEITEVTDANGDGRIDLADVRHLIQNDKNVLSVLKENGDFRSRECIELLKEADIVVTNPPFSLFREYVAQLMKYEKKFIIIGNKSAIHYKEVFPLIKANLMWVGYTPMSKDLLFKVPHKSEKDYLANGKEGSNYKIVEGKIFGRSPSIWYTNIDTTKRHDHIILYKEYTPEEYPTYDNFDAIDVKEVNDIPNNFNGVMGVPDTFLAQYNPDEFELIGIGSGNLAKQIGVKKNYRGRTDIAYTINGVHKCPYSRILIRRKQ